MNSTCVIFFDFYTSNTTYQHCKDREINSSYRDFIEIIPNGIGRFENEPREIRQKIIIIAIRSDRIGHYLYIIIIV